MKQLNALLFLCCICLFTNAQKNILLPKYLQFEPDLPYDKNIPSPKDFLGYELGEAMTLYTQTANYFEQLDQTSDRIKVSNYGETYEGRPLIYAVITSVKNHARLDEIRQNNLALAAGKEITSQELTNRVDKQPIVVSFSYNIHGNEASCTEAAMQVAYRLAATTDQATEDLLDNVVFIMFPCLNPDGRDRYIYWYKSMRRDLAATSPSDLDHHAPWPNGRTNHYWFDLNRDWIWGVHPESRGHTKIYQEWMPQLHTDYHEMGYNSNYFTMPGTTPRNLLLPDRYEALSDTIGKANIATFDENKMNYFTREAFDFFYPGYGSSYPSILGAIGMLVEQGGIGGGRAIETNDGYVLTLRQRIFDHYLTSLATLKKAVENKQEFMRYTYEALLPKNSKSKTKAYILANDKSDYTQDVLKMLRRQNVEIQQANESFSIADAHSFKDNNPQKKRFEKGTYIISTDQSRHLFLNSIMGRNMEIEDSVMYDMATWSAPLAYNLESYYTEQAVNVNTTLVEEIAALPKGLKSVKNPYAYVIDWNQRYAPRALSMLWEKGYRVRAAVKDFGDGKLNFSKGSLTILVGRNREKVANIEKDMQEIAEQAEVVIHGLATGRMNSGIDLASNRNRPIKQPKVALLVEPPFNTYTCGQLYFLFDQETRLPVDRIRTSMLMQTAIPKLGSRYGYTDLNDYDVLILAGGRGRLNQIFKEKQLQEIEAWIKSGGTLVATESAASFFSKANWKSSMAVPVSLNRDTSDTAKYLAFEDRQDYYGKKNVPGSALLSHIDISNPLAFGVKKEVYSLKFGNTAFQPNTSLQTVGYYHKNVEELLVAGYASQENLEKLAGNVFAATQPMGQGKIVYLLDNTQYRMFWLGTARMMQNAVLFSGM
ncbi:MAG: M14 family zinc carboxypeptidase [Bacteroidota bacterium]